MGGKLDLARLLREIGEEKKSRAGKSRSLTQEEIRRLVAERTKAPAGASSPPQPSGA